MKKLFLLTINYTPFVLSLVMLFNFSLFAQWQPDVRLTNNPATSNTSYNNAWCIASSGSLVHVVWWDNRDGNEEIYYKRSTDEGLSWESDTRLTNNTAISRNPSVSVSGTVVHVVWRDDRDGDEEIFYKRSTDAGVSWGTDTRLTNSSSWSDYPSVAVSGQGVHVVWFDYRDGNPEIYYKRSTDWGISWGADIRLSNNTANSWRPSIAVSGAGVHVVWFDNRDGNFEIYYGRSTNGGVTWLADTRLTNNTAWSGEPSVAVTGLVVHVVWQDYRDGSFVIYYKRSTDGGVSWGTDTRLTYYAAISGFPSVAVSGTVVHVIWSDDRDGNYEIYYKRSSDGGVSWGGDTRLTNNFSRSEYPSVAVSGSVVHVVWQDNRDGNWEIYYKRDPTGNPVGVKNISSEIPKEFTLSQNYPNPFNHVTSIVFDIPKSSFVKLYVYDVTGREVDLLVNENLSAGKYQTKWNTEKYSSGVYFYRLSAGDFTETVKMILVK